MFVLHEASAQTLREEELALRDALKPLVENKDGHFIAAVTALVQSLLEARTDCPISGVFGAGKTLSAAAMIAGLLVMDPTLQIMIVTKENVAKHFLRLGLPDSINSLVGRLVGHVELQKGPANKTDLDVPPAFRNDVLRSKKVLVGCGGGYHQECSQPYSPVAKWIEEVDVHGRTTLWETVFSIFSDPENGSILKHRPIWIIRKVLCVWADFGRAAD